MLSFTSEICPAIVAHLPMNFKTNYGSYGAVEFTEWVPKVCKTITKLAGTHGRTSDKPDWVPCAPFDGAGVEAMRPCGTALVLSRARLPVVVRGLGRG